MSPWYRIGRLLLAEKSITHVYKSDVVGDDEALENIYGQRVISGISEISPLSANIITTLSYELT